MLLILNPLLLLPLPWHFLLFPQCRLLVALLMIILVLVLPSTLGSAKIKNIKNNKQPFSQEIVYRGDGQMISARHVCVHAEMGTAYSESRIQASSIAQEGSSEGLIQFSGC